MTKYQITFALLLTTIFGCWSEWGIKLKDGRHLVSDITRAQGDPENKLSDDIIWNKYNTLAEPVLGQEKSTQLRKTIQQLPTSDTTDKFFNFLSQNTQKGTD